MLLPKPLGVSALLVIALKSNGLFDISMVPASFSLVKKKYFPSGDTMTPLAKQRITNWMTMANTRVVALFIFVTISLGRDLWLT